MYNNRISQQGTSKWFLTVMQYYYYYLNKLCIKSLCYNDTGNALACT